MRQASRKRWTVIKRVQRFVLVDLKRCLERVDFSQNSNVLLSSAASLVSRKFRSSCSRHNFFYFGFVYASKANFVCGIRKIRCRYAVYPLVQCSCARTASQRRHAGPRRRDHWLVFFPQIFFSFLLLLIPSS